MYQIFYYISYVNFKHKLIPSGADAAESYNNPSPESKILIFSNSKITQQACSIS